MATNRDALNNGSIGTQSDGLAFGGRAGGTTSSAATEEWTGPSTTLNYKTLTTS